MAEALGAAGSIVGIAAFGLKSLTTIQAYVDAVSDADSNLHSLVIEVKATASTLKQLHDFIVHDQAAAVVVAAEGDGNIDSDNGGSNSIRIANDEGVRQAIQLASQCKQVYTAIIKLIAKDVGAPRDGNGEVSLDDLSLDAVKTPAIQKFKWSLREPRVRKLREELAWLKFSLMLHLQVMELARSKMTLV